MLLISEVDDWEVAFSDGSGCHRGNADSPNKKLHCRTWARLRYQHYSELGKNSSRCYIQYTVSLYRPQSGSGIFSGSGFVTVRFLPWESSKGEKECQWWTTAPAISTGNAYTAKSVKNTTIGQARHHEVHQTMAALSWRLALWRRRSGRVQVTNLSKALFIPQSRKPPTY